MISAYRDTEKNRQYEPTKLDRPHVYIFILVFHWGMSLLLLGAITFITPVTFVNIPTPAMDPALKVGDRLAFKKTRSIARYDVGIFWFPMNPETMFVKRCIGLPGDSLKIKDGQVYLNGVPQKDMPLKFKYDVTTDGSTFSKRTLENNEITADDYMEVEPDMYQFFLTKEQAGNFKSLPFVKKIERVVETAGSGHGVYPPSELDWSADFYGPIYIPKKGDQIELTEKNIGIYLKYIEDENHSVARYGSGLTIDGQPITTYTFKENYYFMMGDNRHNTLDSRYWGFLPEKMIIGKAMYLFWGKTSDRIGKALK